MKAYCRKRLASNSENNIGTCREQILLIWVMNLGSYVNMVHVNTETIIKFFFVDSKNIKFQIAKSGDTMEKKVKESFKKERFFVGTEIMYCQNL